MGEVTRREVLGRALAAGLGSGLIFGLPSLLRAGDNDRGRRAPDPKDKGWPDALAYMKQHGLDGLAIVVPEDAAAQAALGERLSALLPLVNGHGKLGAMALAQLEVVWGCAKAKAVGAKPGETVVLLDPKGKRIAGAKIDFAGEQKKVEAALLELIAGSKGERQAARVKRVLADPKLKEAYDAYTGDPKKNDAFMVLYNAVDRAAPLFVAGARNLDAKVKARFLSVLNERYFQRQQRKSGFPHGVEWKLEVDQPEPCPPCGMARPTVAGREFLRFFTR